MTAGGGDRPLHPRRGVHRPRPASPPLQPGTVRRTSTFDAGRPHGLDGLLVLTGTGRDLLVPVTGPARPLERSSVEATVDYLGGRAVLAIGSDPVIDLEALVGVTASSGFRRALEALRPPGAEPGTLAHWLLDEVPVITLVSGFALSHARVTHPYTGKANARPDLCAGWAEGATIMQEIRRSGRSPVPTGPPAPDLDGDDALAWHEAGPLAPHTVRRRRLLDVRLVDGGVRADALFRDSHADEDGRETVVHEYGVTAEVDPGSWTVTGSGAVDDVLPWIECSAAVDSATRLRGQDVRGLRGWVRAELTGVTTCTHLNDTLRGLADLPHLARPLLARAAGEGRNI